MAFTAQQILDLDRMNEASRLAGGLGTVLNDGLFGGISTPDAGTILPMATVSYDTTPALGTNTYVHAAVTLGAAAQDVTTGITNCDYPRVLLVKGNASGIAGDCVITGRNANDEAITETIALSGASAVLGTKGFKTILNINLPAKTNGSGDTVSVGVGNKLSFPVAIPNASLVLAKSFDGAADSSTITTSTTVEGSLAAVAGTFNGVKHYVLYFLAPTA